VGAGAKGGLALSFSTATVAITGRAAIWTAVLAGAAQAEINMANKLMVKNKFLVINLAFMAIPLFFFELLSERVGFQFCASCFILYIG
jgi:hypothetical protein